MGPYFIVIAGTAGSGKSTLTSAFGDWLESMNLPVVRVNLDPAAEDTPYSPNVDVREYVNIRDVMRRFNLGPNGALLTAIDMLYNYIDDVSREIERNASPNDYVLVDTPGQLELFAYRRGSREVLRGIIGDRRAVMLFLIDALLIADALNVASLILLATSVNLRLGIPMVCAVSKSDLLTDELRDLVESINEDPERLVEILRSGEVSKTGIEGLVEMALSRPFTLIPVSSFDESTFGPLFSAMQIALGSGEEVEIPELPVE